MGIVKTWKGGYTFSRQQIVDNIRGYHFRRTCWRCGTVDECRCDPEHVTFRKPTWYCCIECKIKRGELDANGYPLR